MPTMSKEYIREWKVKRKGKLEEEAEARRNGGGEWEEFQEHIREEAMKKGASSAIMGIYKEVLKINRQMGKREGIGADELAKRNIEAERQLIEGGYIEQ